MENVDDTHTHTNADDVDSKKVASPHGRRYTYRRKCMTSIPMETSVYYNYCWAMAVSAVCRMWTDLMENMLHQL